MPRNIMVVRQISVLSVTGLARAKDCPYANPLFWDEGETRKTPPIVRFIWLPTNGETHVGVQCSHRLLLPRGHEYPLEAWLRGFSFQRERVIALRTFYWPRDPYDWFDTTHARLDLRISRSFVKTLRPHLPPKTLIFDGISNGFLKQRFSHLSLRW